MGVHRVFHPGLSGASGSTLLISGEEAHHAVRVKRAEVGDSVALMDGRGHTARARLAEIIKDRKTGEWTMAVVIEDVQTVSPVEPRVEIWASVPKGPRLEDMIDGLSQAGAASWSPLLTERTVVEPREHKLERMHRLAAEASKQCGRAWHLEIGTGGNLGAALARATPSAAGGAGVLAPSALRRGEVPEPARAVGGSDSTPASSSFAPLRVVIADASGEPYRPSGAPIIRLLVGPEGGWAPAELARARERGADVVSFGPHVMRVETAAVVACGIVLDGEIRSR